MEGNIAATYTLIYHFLKQQSQDKAAGAVKRAAKPFVVLRDDIEQQGPALEDIIREWKATKNTKSGSAESSSEESESSDDSDTSSDSEDGSDPRSKDRSCSDAKDSSGSDSSSEDTSDSENDGEDTSDSDDSDDDSGEGTTCRNVPTQKVAARDTSTTLSSAGENAQEAVKPIVQIPKKTPTKAKDKNKGSESDTSDSDSSSEDSTSDSSDAESSSSSSSSSDSSDQDEVNASGKAPQSTAKSTEDESSSSSESSSASESKSKSGLAEDMHVAKKRKISESGTAVTTAIASGLQRVANTPQRKENALQTVKARFQRIKVQNLTPEQFLDNGYMAKGGATNDYGERAHRDLIVTRGAGFRKEKNKKKRGSYRGGKITMENHSIKFEF